jgi:hypothetical protein
MPIVESNEGGSGERCVRLSTFARRSRSNGDSWFGWLFRVCSSALALAGGCTCRRTQYDESVQLPADGVASAALDGGEVQRPGATYRACALPSVVHEDLVVPAGCLISGSAGVEVRAKLLLEPGVTLRFGAGGSLTITGDGVLAAAGTKDFPIIFTSSSDAGWAGIRSDGSVLLDHVRVEGGGSTPAGLLARGGRITLRDTSISSESVALAVFTSVRIDAIDRNRLSGKMYSAELAPDAIGGLGKDNVFSGPVRTRGDVTRDQTWRAIGVPEFVAPDRIAVGPFEKPRGFVTGRSIKNGL